MSGSIRNKIYSQVNKVLESYGYGINSPYGETPYNWGFQYNLVPLSTNLSQRGNDKDQKKKYDKVYDDQMHVGDIATGIGAGDQKKHKGNICNFTYKDNSGTSLKFVWIFDEKTMKRVALMPKTVKIMKKEFKNDFHRKFGWSALRLQESELEKMNDPEEIEARERLIDEYRFTDYEAKYYDDKFYNQKYEDDFCEITSIKTDSGLAEIMTGTDEFDIEFVNMICEMYGQSGSDIRFQSDDEVVIEPSIIISSWKDLLSLVEAISNARDEYRADDDYFDNDYSGEYEDMVRKFIVKLTIGYEKYLVVSDTKNGYDKRISTNTIFGKDF